MQHANKRWSMSEWTEGTSAHQIQSMRNLRKGLFEKKNKKNKAA
jgi:hypothetical protein